MKHNKKLRSLTQDLEDQNLVELWRERAEVLKEGNDEVTMKEQYNNLTYGIIPENYAKNEKELKMK